MTLLGTKLLVEIRKGDNGFIVSIHYGLCSTRVSVFATMREVLNHLAEEYGVLTLLSDTEKPADDDLSSTELRGVTEDQHG